MKDRKVFTEKLGIILQMALNKNGKISLKEVEDFFQEDSLSEEQLGLVCDYLMSQRIAVTGYVLKGGQIHTGEEEKTESTLSSEELHYLETYESDLRQMSKKTPEEARLAYYLPKVVEEAKRVHTGEVYIGDLIQEGNMALMLAFMEYDTVEVDEAEVMNHVRAAIQTEATAQAEVHMRDNRMVSKVSELDETIQQMSDAAKGKVSVDEVAESLGISEGDIADILSLAGESVEESASDEEGKEEKATEKADINDMFSVLDKDDVIDLQDPKFGDLGISWGDDDGETDDDVVF